MLKNEELVGDGEWIWIKVVVVFGGLCFLFWWWGIFSNSVNFLLEIGFDGICYCVIVRCEWCFFEIESVDVCIVWCMVNLYFCFCDGLGMFLVNVCE